MASSHQIRKLLYRGGLVATLLFPMPLEAYEVETHAAISTRAADSSTVGQVLIEPDELRRFGIVPDAEGRVRP